MVLNLRLSLILCGILTRGIFFSVAFCPEAFFCPVAFYPEFLSYCGPEVLFKTCVAMKFVDDDDDDD